MIKIKNEIRNINCSFKKIKKVISYKKKFNEFSRYINFLCNNFSKSFTIIKKIIYNTIKNYYYLHKKKYNNIKLDYLYVNKGKRFKKIYPRAKGKIDFFKRDNIIIKICLKFNNG